MVRREELLYIWEMSDLDIKLRRFIWAQTAIEKKLRKLTLVRTYNVHTEQTYFILEVEELTLKFLIYEQMIHNQAYYFKIIEVSLLLENIYKYIYLFN